MIDGVGDLTRVQIATYLVYSDERGQLAGQLLEAMDNLEFEKMVSAELASDVYHQLRMRGKNHLDYDLEEAEEQDIMKAARKEVSSRFMQTCKGTEVTESCGNVFEDLGLPDAEELLRKADEDMSK
jgi:hypothetical protein